MGAVDGYPLRLVDRRRVAMIEIAIIFDVECDAAPVINANRHALFADPLDRPERAILHLQAALVAQEHHAVAGCKVPVAALDCQADIIAKVARRAHSLSRGFVELAHLGIGVGEDDATRSEEHTSELQSLMRISYAVFCLKTKKNIHK